MKLRYLSTIDKCLAGNWLIKMRFKFWKSQKQLRTKSETVWNKYDTSIWDKSETSFKQVLNKF